MFFQNIEDMRIDNDKTQEEIAKLLNCKREVYRRYEKGIHEIPVWAVIKLANCHVTPLNNSYKAPANRRKIFAVQIVCAALFCRAWPALPCQSSRSLTIFAAFLRLSSDIWA